MTTLLIPGLRVGVLLLAALAAPVAWAQPVTAAMPRCTLAAVQAAVVEARDAGRSEIDAVRWFAGGATEDGRAATAANPILPAHCIVTGVIGAHLGPPAATRYGNHFRLRVPADWNGRFVFQGGGGNNGTVGNALGLLKDGQLALAQGYAVAAQDSGHEGGAPTFALDRQAYLDFAHVGVHQVTALSKSLLEAVAGKAPQRSYFVGCSNGGREAMVSAQRYDDFDGVVAGAPGFAVYDQWLQNMDVLRTVASVAGTPAGSVPQDTSKAYTDAQLDRVAAHFFGKCDGLDGLVDGVLSHPTACIATDADFKTLRCAANGGNSDHPDCLSAAQAQGLQRIYDGARDSRGQRLFPGFMPGGIERVLRVPYLGVPGSAQPLGQFYGSIMANFYFMGYGWQGWPGVHGPADQLSSYPASSLAYVAGFDFDTEPARLAAGRLDFHGSNVDPARPGPNFEGFRKRGGKLLIYTGTADQGVQAKGVIDFMDRLRAQYTPAGAEQMAALFLVPGMNHCRGGAATELFDPLAALVAWVEQGRLPERIVARVVPGGVLDQALPGMTRPLCPYPRYARYDGKGPPAAAASFVCALP